MENNVLGMLRMAAAAERRSRKKAVICLEGLTKQLAEAFLPLFGDKRDDDDFPNAVVSIDRELYFRYAPHYGEEKDENEGFYIDRDRYLNVWGESLLSLRGKEFWHQVVQITNWAYYNLPEMINELEEVHAARLDRLQNIVGAIQELKETGE